MYEQILEALIIAIGNCVGIGIGSWLFIDRKIDRKISKYVRLFRSSEEGKDMGKLLSDAKKFVDSGEMQDLVGEAKAGLKELRGLLQSLRERYEQSQQEDEETEPVIPQIS